MWIYNSNKNWGKYLSFLKGDYPDYENIYRYIDIALNLDKRESVK